MVHTRNASGPSSATDSPRRLNPSRASKSRIMQLVDPSSSLDLSEEEDAVNYRGLDYVDLESDNADFVIGADNTPQALGIPVRAAKVTTSKRASSRGKTRQSGRAKAKQKNKNSKQRPKRKRRDTGAALPSPSKRPRQPAKSDPEWTISSGIIPDWTDPRIPFQFWTDVFYYAACEGTTASIATSWLLLASTSCKFLAEPALETLYRSPIIRNQSKAKKLAVLLEQPISETKFNYRSKIETLHLDIHTVPASIMYQLIHPLPRLKELIICTPFDQPPYRELEKNIRWTYPADIFQALLPGAHDPSEANLKAYHTQLKSWEWSGRLVGGFVDGLKDISRIHEIQSFQSLTRVSFTNFQTPSLRKRSPRNDDEAVQFLNEDNADIEAIAASLAKLPFLSHLVFESSTVMNDHMLSLLPRGLLHLELINCWEIRSFDLAAFLRDKGGEIRILNLQHNQSLDLGFLTDLAETCPKLRELDMNLSYYKLHEGANDSDPMYDQVLLPDQIPHWPPSIRIINIEHIRDWSVEAAVMFMQTLIDNAHNLPNLRHLSVKTMLDIPWQSRATMRTAWRDKMEKVFLRPSPGPPRDFKTLQPKINMEAKTPQSTTSRKACPPPTPPSRRSNRLTETSEAACKQRRSPRHSGGSKMQKSYRETDADEDDEMSESDGGSSHDNESDPNDDDVDHASTASDFAMSDTSSPVQGLCKTVNIVFDNQKVRELQYGMEDFQMDNDGEDDDEWDGDYESDDPVLQF